MTHDPHATLVDDFQMPGTAKELLTAMARHYRYEMSDFEAMMWTARILSRFDDESIMRALIACMERPGRDKQFFPHYGVVLEMLEEPACAQVIEDLVRRGTPYESPRIDDPVLSTAIGLLGGWAQVCSELPDSQENPAGYTAYMRRMEAAMGQAARQIKVHGRTPPSLVGLASQHNRLLALAREQSAKAPKALPAPGASA